MTGKVAVLVCRVREIGGSVMPVMARARLRRGLGVGSIGPIPITSMTVMTERKKKRAARGLAGASHVMRHVMAVTALAGVETVE
jgi:hypothetical protein